MKKIVLFTAILVSAIAADANDIYCYEDDPKTKTYYSVTASPQESGAEIEEGKRVPYDLQVLEIRTDDGAELGTVFYGDAIATQNDVQVWIKGKGVTLGLYLDEADQSWIEIKGKGKSRQLLCEVN